MREQMGPELRSVLDALAENAANVCAAYDALIVLADGAELQPVAHFGPVGSLGLLIAAPIDRDSLAGRAILDRGTVQVEDTLSGEALPVHRALAERQGVRSSLAAPLLKDGAAVGAILIRRLEPGPFSDRQVELLRTFAGLAVIAIENSRLLAEVETRNRELAEALEHQTATSDVLRIISSSPTELRRVLDAICERAAQVSGASDAFIRLIEADQLVLAGG